MSNLIEVFGASINVKAKSVESPETQLRNAIERAGLKPPQDIFLDGTIHKFKSDDKPRETGWYIAFGDGIPAGRFGCWRNDVNEGWRADIGRELTQEEVEQSKKQMEQTKRLRAEELTRQREIAAEDVREIWESSQVASDDYPYLKNKRVKAHGARLAPDGRLITPIYNEAYQLVSLQYISVSGSKQYHAHGRVSGCCWLIGAPSDTIYVVEGFATGATVHEVSGQMVAVAYSAHNLPSVVERLREGFGDVRIVVVADNDKSGVGRAKADEAAAKFGAHIVMPPELGDANDYHNAGNDLMEILTPTVSDWLVPVDEWCKQPAPISWLVKNWIQSDALMMVHGPSGGGKTFIVLDWALRIASTIGAWRQHKVRNGPVVYLAGEGHHGLRSRVAAWKHRHKVGRCDMWLSRAGCDLNTPAGYQRVAEALRALPKPPKLIIVDTLHRFLLGDENSAQDTKTMLDACSSLIENFQCSVLLVHHTGVSEDAQHRARGSSAWRGALDIEVSVVPAKGKQPIEIVQRKSKDAELAEPQYARLESVAIPGWLDEDKQPITSAVVVDVEAAPKANPKLSEHKKRFGDAWLHGGATKDQSSRTPYLRRDALIKYLVDVEGLKENSAKTIASSTGSNRTIGALVDAELIEVTTGGWLVSDNSWSSFLNIAAQPAG
jgi:putative DNA primase/helicase